MQNAGCMVLPQHCANDGRDTGGLSNVTGADLSFNRKGVLKNKTETGFSQAPVSSSYRNQNMFFV